MNARRRKQAPLPRIDATFIKDSEFIKKTGEIQELLYFLDEENFFYSVDRINKIRFSDSFQPVDLARDIICSSYFCKNKNPLLVRLVASLMAKNDIIEQIVLNQCFKNERYFMKMKCRFISLLQDARLFSSSYQSELEKFKKESERIILSEKANLIAIIEDDDIEKLKQKFVDPTFNINANYFIGISPMIEEFEFTLLELAAYYGSIACFRYLYINDAKLIFLPGDNVLLSRRKGFNIMQIAIAGGNVDIIQLIEQAGVHPDQSCIKYAIRFHRIEIFDWLVDQFPELDDFSNDFFRHKFIHGINRLDTIDAQETFEAICENGHMHLFKIIYQSNFNLNPNPGLINACRFGHIEIVKVLLSNPSIDVNSGNVNIVLMRFYF